MYLINPRNWKITSVDNASITCDVHMQKTNLKLQIHSNSQAKEVCLCFSMSPVLENRLLTVDHSESFWVHPQRAWKQCHIYMIIKGYEGTPYLRIGSIKSFLINDIPDKLKQLQVARGQRTVSKKQFKYINEIITQDILNWH